MHSLTTNSESDRFGPRLAASKRGYFWIRYPDGGIIAWVKTPELGKGRHRKKWWKP